MRKAKAVAALIKGHIFIGIIDVLAPVSEDNTANTMRIAADDR